MKTIIKLASVFILLIFFGSCARVFYAPDALTIAGYHKTIAIVPPKVSIAARRNVDAEAMKEQQKTESLNIQHEMYFWMMKRKSQGKILVDIQDVDNTNSTLAKAGYPATALSPAEICQVLGVDGIIASNYSLSKPMSEGAAVALGLLVGVWGATNEVMVTMNIQDAASGNQIWSYNHRYSGGLGSTPAQLVDGLMRNASRKMPYFVKNSN